MIGTIILLLLLLVPFPIARLLLRNTSWTKRRVILTAATALPALVVFVVIGFAAIFAPSAGSSVDTVSGAMLSTVPSLAIAALLFAIGVAVAAIAERTAPRSRGEKQNDLNKIFE